MEKMYYFHLTGVLRVSPRFPLTFSNRSVLGVSLRSKQCTFSSGSSNPCIFHEPCRLGTMLNINCH